MKKFVSIISASALLLAVGCSSRSPESSAVTPREPRYNDENKPIITVATQGYRDPLFDDPFLKPKDVEIEFINYAQDIHREDYPDGWEGYYAYYDAIYDAMDRDLISGNIPDIIFADASQMKKLIDKGMLADLYEYMDEFGKAQRLCIFHNVNTVFSALCTYAVYTNFIDYFCMMW